MNKNTQRRIELILGYGIDSGTDTRRYMAIDDVLYTDVFTGTPTIEGYTGTIITRFNGRHNSDYSNEIVLEDCTEGEYNVTASWGSDKLVAELDELVQIVESDSLSTASTNAGVKSKKIEDFNVSYGTREETQADLNTAYADVFSYYIRSIMLISVSKEQRHDERYF